MAKVKRDLRVLGARRLECFDSTAWNRYYSIFLGVFGKAKFLQIFVWLLALAASVICVHSSLKLGSGDQSSSTFRQLHRHYNHHHHHHSQNHHYRQDDHHHHQHCHLCPCQRIHRHPYPIITTIVTIIRINIVTNTRSCLSVCADTLLVQN